MRFKIEVTFKQTIHTMGTHAYHFWMSSMDPLPRSAGNQYLHKKLKAYRDHVTRKLHAYHCPIQAGLIAHGLLNLISLSVLDQIWKHFGFWIPSIRPRILSS